MYLIPPQTPPQTSGARGRTWELIRQPLCSGLASLQLLAARPGPGAVPSLPSRQQNVNSPQTNKRCGGARCLLALLGHTATISSLAQGLPQPLTRCATGRPRVWRAVMGGGGGATPQQHALTLSPDAASSPPTCTSPGPLVLRGGFLGDVGCCPGPSAAPLGRSDALQVLRVEQGRVGFLQSQGGE